MIHKYFLNGYYIVLDVNSGAVHVVDELAYEMLDHLSAPMAQDCPGEMLERLRGRYSENEIEETYAELRGLWESGQLFSEDDYERFVSLYGTSPIKAMCLNVAHDCNLRCDYCFASTGDYCGGRALMSEEVGKKAIDYLIDHSAKRYHLEMDFFGGEPLMNYQVVKKLVEYARSQEKRHNKLFRFTITTNGMLLNDEVVNFLNREMSNIVLSLDGRKQVTNKVRRRVDGGGCYDIIMPKMIDLARKRRPKEYYVRGTFTRYNLDFTEDVLHLRDLGFDQISIEPVISDPSEPYSLTERQLPAIFAEYERLAKLMIKQEKQGDPKDWFNFFHFMIDLDQGPCAIKRLKGCGCGNEYVAVTPQGDVYPCHQFIGHEEWKMGSVLDNSLDLDMKKRFAAATVYGKPQCRSCWAKFYCSGGCSANNYQYSGDILKAHDLSCQLEKKRLECAIMIKAALADQAEE